MAPMNSRLMRPRASGFNPKSISGLALWLEASRYNSSTGDWTDSSGNGRTFQNTVANERPANTGSINGRPALRFATNDYLYGPIVNWTQYTAFAVVVPSSVTGDNGIITADAQSGTRGPQIARWSGTAYQLIGFSTTTLFLEGGGTAAIGTARVISVVQSASAAEMWISGTSNGSTAGTQQAYSAYLAVGVAGFNTPASPSVNGFMNGDLGEIVMYDRALTATERSTVEKALGKKWGITVA